MLSNVHYDYIVRNSFEVKFEAKSRPLCLLKQLNYEINKSLCIVNIFLISLMSLLICMKKTAHKRRNRIYNKHGKAVLKKD